MLDRLVISASLATLVAVSAAPAAEKSMNLNRTAKSGVDSGLAYSHRLDRNCNPQPLTITITKQPMNGTASVLDADEVVPASTPASGSTGACAGKTVKAKKIMYRSNAGFRGNDTVSYDSDGAGTLIHTTIAVTVQ
jgi:hypothetical protein